MSPSRALKEAAFLTGAIAVCLAVFLPWLGFDARLQPEKSALNDYWKARVPDMIYGRAHRPFVQRTLVPTTLRVIRAVLPRATLGALRRLASRPPLLLPQKLGVLGFEPAYMVEYVLAMGLLYTVLLAFPVALRWLFEALYRAPRAALLAPLVATGLLPVLFFDRGTHYLYDFSTLLLFTLAFSCLARNRTIAFYVVFLLGCLNKETMILTTLVFALVERERMGRAALLRHVLFQLLIFAGLEWGLRHAFLSNPGGGAEWHLLKNLRLMKVLPAPSSIVLLLSCAVLTLARFGEKPAFLRLSALATALPLAVAYVFFGIWGEIRVFYEAYPVLFLLAFQNASEGLGLPLREAGPGKPPPGPEG